MAEKLLKELNCQDIYNYMSLSKSQMVEKMDLLQCHADEFQTSNTDENAILAFIIIHIGCYFPTETDDWLKKSAEEEGVVQPAKSTVDGSKICGNYILTVDRDPFAAAEYSCRLSSAKNTFAI